MMAVQVVDQSTWYHTPRRGPASFSHIAAKATVQPYEKGTLTSLDGTLVL